MCAVVRNIWGTSEWKLNYHSGAKNFEVAPIFLENLCTLSIYLFSNKSKAAFPRLTYVTHSSVICIVHRAQCIVVKLFSTPVCVAVSCYSAVPLEDGTSHAASSASKDEH